MECYNYIRCLTSPIKVTADAPTRSGHPPRRQIFETPLHRSNRRLADHRMAECGEAAVTFRS